MYDKYVELRDKKGVRDADVSKATGVSQVTLSEWKTRSNPKLDKLSKIAEYFGVTVEYFVS